MRYGPYSAIGLSVEYRTFRLEGMQGGQLNTGGPHSSVCPGEPQTFSIHACCALCLDLLPSSNPDQVLPPLESLPESPPSQDD